MSYAKTFQRLGVWARGFARARRGAKQHLTKTVGFFTVCGKNDVTMQRVYRGQIESRYAGTPKLIELNKLSDADFIMRYITCKDCRTELAKRALELEEA